MTTVRSLVRACDSVVESSDMAFLLEPEAIEHRVVKQHPGFVGMNVSGLLYYQTIPSLGWTTHDYRLFAQELIDSFVLKHGKTVVLIPHVRSPGGDTDDLQASRDLYDTLSGDVQEHVQVIEEALSARELKYIIGQSAFFVGARMHSCIAALSTRTPVVPISYSYKFAGILKQLGLEYLVCSPQLSASLDEMIEHVDRQYRNRVRVRRELEKSIPAAQKRALACVGYLQ
jgi:polysaccharide pyruvyl transferase WcaK-like protein